MPCWINFGSSQPAQTAIDDLSDGMKRPGSAYVLHKANWPSGGAGSHLELDVFLSRGNQEVPERQALLRLIGTLANPP